MTAEIQFTCYICGRTTDNWITVDMIGLFKDQEAASERFEKKYDEEPDSYLFVCPDCEVEIPYHAENSKDKYGVYQ